MDAMIGKTCAMVVAHPDDETLWGGGLLHRYSDRFWTVIACSTPALDPERAGRFIEACIALGASRCEVLLASDSDELELRQLRLSEYETIVTHNADGEYGHVQHKSVHEAVLGSRSKSQKVLTFGYRAKSAVGGGCVGSLVMRLSRDEVAAKRAALRCYSHRVAINGVVVEKWRAIIARRFVDGYSFGLESYDAL
jgi:LmbE family N-acetylglucosaminyl deacetylase